MRFLFWLSLGSLCSTLAFGAPFSLKGRDLMSSQTLEMTARSRGLVLVFLSSTCPCSDSHVEELAKLSKDFPDLSFYAVHSNQDEPTAAAKLYFEGKKLPFPVIQDDHAVLADRYKAFKTPHVFVLDPKGEILYRGGVSDSAHFARAHTNYLREALLDIQNQRTVKTPEGRTLGCMISREENE